MWSLVAKLVLMGDPFLERQREVLGLQRDAITRRQAPGSRPDPEGDRGLDAPVPLIHLTVPNGSRVRSPAGTVVRYSRRLDQARHPVLPPARTRVEESVLNLAGDASLDEAVSSADVGAPAGHSCDYRFTFLPS